MVTTWKLLTGVTHKSRSVFPFALMMAVPATSLAVILKIMHQEFGEKEEFWNMTFEKGGGAWGGFTSLVVFLLTFRVGQAYSRFSAALTITHQMQGDWSGAASSTAAFCKRDDKSGDAIMFLHMVVRLFSILGACALQELSDVAHHRTLGLETLDSGAFDDETLLSLDSATKRVELVYTWIQQLIAEGIRSGVLDVPAPIAGQILRELSSGLGKFDDAMQHAKIEFPFTYAQTCWWLLIIHWVLTPFVMVQTSEWISGAAIFTFVQIFFIWALKDVCVKFEAPFGGDIEYIEPQQMQRDFNKALCLILSPDARRGAKLDTFAPVTYTTLQTRGTLHQAALQREGWHLLKGDEEEASNCCCCGGTGNEESGTRPKIAISDRYCTKQYGLIDGEKTAAYGVGIYNNYLVLALPCPCSEEDKEKKKLQMDVCEVADLDERPCLVRITRVPVSQRHILSTDPDPDWGMDEYPNFPTGQRFQSQVLAKAYVDQLQRRKLMHQKTAMLLTSSDAARIKDEEEADEMLGVTDTLRTKGAEQQAVANSIHASMLGPKLLDFKNIADNEDGQTLVDVKVEDKNEDAEESAEQVKPTEMETSKSTRSPGSPTQEKKSKSSASLSDSSAQQDVTKEEVTKSKGASHSPAKEADTKPGGQTHVASKKLVALGSDSSMSVV